MSKCHKCGREMHEGTVSLDFTVKGTMVTVSHIPAMVCPCGDSRIKGSVAEYVSDLVDQAVALKRRATAERVQVREIALATA